MSKCKLFGDDDDEVTGDVLSINKTYASKYSSWRVEEEMKFKKLTQRDLETDSGTSDDEYADPDNPEFNMDFLKTLSALGAKDQSINDPKKVFWKDSYPTATAKTSKEEDKPMLLGDFQRKMFLRTGGKYEDSDEEGPEQEQHPIRKHGFDRDGKSKSFGFDDDNIIDDDDLFAKKTETCEDAKKTETCEGEDLGNPETDDIYEYVKGTRDSLKSKKDEPLLKGIRDTWNADNLSKQDMFLKDFFLNKRYLQGDDDPRYVNDEYISEDEDLFGAHEDFSTKYNFRFEEPDQDFIKSYPRVTENSLRMKDEKRKVKREKVKERKAEMLVLKQNEIMQLKAIKRKEIVERLKKINETAGVDVALLEKELKNIFAPKKYDKIMEEVFGNDYYDIEDGPLEKPVFEDDEEYSDYDAYVVEPEKKKKKRKRTKLDKNQEQMDDQEDEEDEDNYDNYDGSKPSSTNLEEEENSDCSSGKTLKHKSRFMESIRKEKPLFDPELSTFEEYFNDYYNLDFGDIVGGMPVRFNYQKVEPNNFGLTTEEMLSATDAELNRWYSIKQLLNVTRTKQEEEAKQTLCVARAASAHYKNRILLSLSQGSDEALLAEQTKKRAKYEKKKLRKKVAMAEKEQIKKEMRAERKLGHRQAADIDNMKLLMPHSEEEDTKPDIEEQETKDTIDNLGIPSAKISEKHKIKPEVLDETIENNIKEEITPHIEEEAEIQSPTKKSKKRKRKHEILDETTESNIKEEMFPEIQSPTKKSKKRKRKHEILNETIESNSKEETSSHIEEEDAKYTPLCTDVQVQIQECDTFPTEKSKKRKKKKREVLDGATENNTKEWNGKDGREDKLNMKEPIESFDNQQSHSNEYKRERMALKQETLIDHNIVSKPFSQNKFFKTQKRRRPIQPKTNMEKIPDSRLEAYGVYFDNFRRKVKSGRKAY